MFSNSTREWKPVLCRIGLHRWRRQKHGANQFVSHHYHCDRCWHERPVKR